MIDLGSRVRLALAQSLSPAGAPEFNLDSSGWEAFWISARDHCLVPYLHKRWSASGNPEALPPEIAGRFAAGRQDNAERNRRLLILLSELLSALRERGINTLVSKGLPLAQAYYGDPGLRVLYDLDLFVRSEDSGQAIDVLRNIGYQPFLSTRGSESGRPFWRPREYAWDAEGVFDPNRPVMVELHTRPWEPHWHGFRLECTLDPWRGVRVVDVGGVTLQVPGEEQLLVQLAVHYSCNVLECSARLMHLLDIVLLLWQRGSDLDWETVLSFIRQDRLEPFCFLAFDLAARVGGCRIPGEPWKALRDATPPTIVRWSELRGVRDICSMSLHNRERSLIYLLHWNMAEGWTERASVLFDSVRGPWQENAGPGRWKSLAARMSGRLQHLLHALRSR